MVRLATKVVDEATDDDEIVYGTPALLVMFRLMPLVKLLPSMDKVCGIEEETIPAGVIEVIVVAGGEVGILSPQDVSPNVRMVMPASLPK